MLNLIVGLGNQGLKRKKFFKKNEIISCDTKNKFADYNSVDNLPIKKIDTVYLCLPDYIKNKFIKFFLSNNKNILVEKPTLLLKKDYNFIKKKMEGEIFYGFHHKYEKIINMKK